MNGYGQSVVWTIPVSESMSAPTTNGNPGDQAPTDIHNTYSMNVSNYFNGGETYSASSPYGNVYVSGNILYYTIYCRNTKYAVTMQIVSVNTGI